MKLIKITNFLSKKYGGKWKYIPKCGWECDDGIRYVQKVLTGKDISGEYTGETSLCLYFRDNSKPSEWL